MKEIAQAVIGAALRAADPAEAVRRHWPDGLGGRTDVIAIGKGAPAMARAAGERLGGAMGRGLVVAPDGLDVSGLERFGIAIGDHPLPTERSLAAGREARMFVESCKADRLLVLVSGGGSALMIDPVEGLDVEGYRRLTGSLLGAGATIDEINAVRRAVDRLKGGGLARLSRAPVTALILSDVLGDPVETISSGPTATEVNGPEPEWVLANWGMDGVDPVVDRAAAEWTFEPAEADNRIIGSNRLAVDAVAEALESMGMRIADRRTEMSGEAADVGRSLGEATESLEPGSAVVWGGETTVRLGVAPGKGGRNQEMALAAALELRTTGAHVLAFGTDGIDGPTDAAGGLVDSSTADTVRARGIDPAGSLRRHDSYHALDGAGALVRTGRTGTNVNDIYAGWRVPS